MVGIYTVDRPVPSTVQGSRVSKKKKVEMMGEQGKKNPFVRGRIITGVRILRF